MTLPTDLQPKFLLLRHKKEFTSFWSILSGVVTLLKLHGYPSQAAEFRMRALALNQNDDDNTDLLALVGEYARIE